jgi:putative transposase
MSSESRLVWGHPGGKGDTYFHLAHLEVGTHDQLVRSLSNWCVSPFSRIVVPGLPLHVTARGNRREPIFFEDGDQDIYCDILAEQLRKATVETWAYCLMPNHVHLILCPAREDGLALALGAAHRRWANFINARGRWRGHLFDGRFASVAMDERHLLAAVRYVALNPVRARLAARAEDWTWSSARAHLAGQDDSLVLVRPVLERVERFADLIAAGDTDEPTFAALRASELTGRPSGTPEFVADLERLLGRPVARRAPGRKPNRPAAEQPPLL